jgi:hypothetical protein
LNSDPGRVGEVAKEKLHSILSENPGYQRICDIEEFLAGKCTELPGKTISNSGANRGFCTCTLKFLWGGKKFSLL